MTARERRKMRARSVRRAFLWFRAHDIVAHYAIELARAESWSYQTGARAHDWDVHDSDEPSLCSEVAAGFERGLSNEFHAQAPQIRGTWPWVASDVDRRLTHAQALAELKAHVERERCPDCGRPVTWSEVDGWQHADPSASCFLHRARLERAS